MTQTQIPQHILCIYKNRELNHSIRFFCRAWMDLFEYFYHQKMHGHTFLYGLRLQNGNNYKRTNPYGVMGSRTHFRASEKLGSMVNARIFWERAFFLKRNSSLSRGSVFFKRKEEALKCSGLCQESSLTAAQLSQKFQYNNQVFIMRKLVSYN